MNKYRGKNKQEYLSHCIKEKHLCRFCKKTGGDILTTSYWGYCWSLCHTDCKKTGEKGEAYDLQCIDADCNDCKYFVRGARINKTTSLGVCNRIFGRRVYPNKTKRTSQPRFNFLFWRRTKAIAYVNYASGHDCFKHRLD